MAVCLVTGGAGFIGSHLVDALVARGKRVRVLDNFVTGSLANLSHSIAEIEIFHGDVNDPDLLQRAMSDVEYVFHFMAPTNLGSAGPQSTPGHWAAPPDTLNVLEAARRAQVHRVIFASSGGIYGPAVRAELKETDPTMPVIPCAFAKQTAENQCSGFTMLYGLETVRLRFFNVFGPRQSITSPYVPVIPAIVRSMLAGHSVEILASPYAKQDLLYIADAVHAALLAVEAPRVAGKVYNIARGRTATLGQVVAAVNQILGTNIQPQFSEAGQPDHMSPSVNIARAEAELGFCPTNDLKQGLRRFLDHLQLQQRETAISAAESVPVGGNGPSFLKLRGSPSAMAQAAIQADSRNNDAI